MLIHCITKFRLYDLGKYNEAIECFDKALKINPKYANALYNKALALGKLRGTKSEGKKSGWKRFSR
ncbi:MAG: tetratricopeptide repeat protein [Nitrososphaeraceae archaeon]